MSARYPNIAAFFRGAGVWLASSIVPFVAVATVANLMGYERGQEAGRLEMKCAFMAIFERLDHAQPAPGTITFGCEKLERSK